MSGPRLVLEVRAEERQHAAGLAVEAAPEPDELGLAGVRLGEAEGRLDGLGAAAVELRAIEIARCDVRDQLDESCAVLGGEAADVDPGDLALDGGDVFRVGVSEAGDADTREEIDVAAAIEIVEHDAFAAIDAEPAEQRDALGAGSEKLGLGVEGGEGAGPGACAVGWSGGAGLGERRRRLRHVGDLGEVRVVE